MPYVELRGHARGDSYRIYYRMFPEAKRPEATTEPTRPSAPSSARRPRVLLLMGMSSIHTFWKPQAQHLERSCDVCAVDNRGTGFSGAPKNEWRWTTKRMALDALAVLDHLGWDRGVHVVGMSMGGMIASELALLAPSRIASLALVATYASARGSMPTLLGMFNLLKSTGLLGHGPKEQGLAGMQLNFPRGWLLESRPSELHGGQVVTNERWMKKYAVLMALEVPQELLEREVPPAAPIRTSAKLRQLSAVLTHHVDKGRAQPFLRCKVPVLVITGDDDCLVRPMNSQILSRLFGAPVHVLRGCGHALIYQEPEEVNAALEALINEGEELFLRRESLSRQSAESAGTHEAPLQRSKL